MNRRPVTLSTLRISRAFTLLEMLVVIVILALVAQTAMLAIDATVDAERRAATVTTLENVEHAIVGRKGVLDPMGRVWIEGFVADVGRLPRIAPDGTLRELWEKPDGVPAYSLRDVVESKLFPNDEFGSGWRGPYLRLPLGDNSLSDGWAQPFQLVENLTEGGLRIKSLGADWATDSGDAGVGYDATLELGIAPKEYCGVFQIDWSPKSSLEEVRVELWRPLDGVPDVMTKGWLAAIEPAISYTLDDEKRVTIGHQMIVFAVRDTETKTLKRVEKRSIVVVPMGVVGGNPVFDTELP